MPDEVERLLIQSIRQGDQQAWGSLIQQYEGRLLAFVTARLHNKSQAEDIVQETFIGFLTSLPNYQEDRSLESFLFSIAAHKLIDHFRAAGERPKLPLLMNSQDESMYANELTGSARPASSLFRSRERKETEEALISEHLSHLISQWKANGEWERLEVMELLWVSGWKNKLVAARLGISEQTVANHKNYVIRLLKQEMESLQESATVIEFG